MPKNKKSEFEKLARLREEGEDIRTDVRDQIGGLSGTKRDWRPWNMIDYPMIAAFRPRSTGTFARKKPALAPSKWSTPSADI
jgi:hypothetical protein